MQQEQPKSPSIIDNAPLSLNDVGATASSLEEVTTERNRLRNEKAELEDEIDRLKGEMSIETQKAKLLIPYSNKVFWFCVWFCLISGWIIMLHADQANGFKLPDSTLAIIAGSTLASVIGLLTSIVTGIYKSE